VLFMSGHWPTKGIFLLPQIFEAVKKEIRQVRFFVLGRETYYTLWLRRRIGPEVRIVGYTDPEPYLKRSCILLHPAVYDAFSCAVLEAMASGLIPIISDRTGVKEFVGRISGKLVLKLDPELFADRVIEILNMPLSQKKELSNELRERALSPYFTEWYSVEKFKRSFIELLR